MGQATLTWLRDLPGQRFELEDGWVGAVTERSRREPITSNSFRLALFEFLDVCGVKNAGSLVDASVCRV